MFITFLYSDNNENALIQYNTISARVAAFLWLVTAFLRLVLIAVTCENVTNGNKTLSGSVQKLLLRQDLTADSVQKLNLFSF